MITKRPDNHSIYPTENLSCIKFCGSKFTAGLCVHRALLLTSETDHTAQAMPFDGQ